MEAGDANPLGPHATSPRELADRIAAERAGRPFLVYRGPAGEQHIRTLAPAGAPVSIGRAAECTVSLAWDAAVSRLHAELSPLGGEWLIADDGWSSNGTWVGGQRITLRRRLRDGDVIRIGETALLYRAPGSELAPTRRPADDTPVVAVTPQQRRVLVALCRPLAAAPEGSPASNAAIAAELHLSIAGVKSHLRALCRAFDIDHLPQHDKRRRLVTLAFTTGVVTDRDL